FSSSSCHFRPFSDVLRRIFRSLTREAWNCLKTPRIMRMSRVRTVEAAVSAALSGLKRRRRHAHSASVRARLPLQLDYFGANEAPIFRNMAPFPTELPDLRIQVS